MNKSFSRRSFLGGTAALAGYAALRPAMPAWAQSAPEPVVSAWRGGDFDTQAKLCFNENNYGPSPAVLKAMGDAFKYANRYGYPDGGLTETIATLHGVSPNNVLLGAGSTEILEIVAEAFVTPGKKVIGVEPTFGSVYEFATGLRGNAIKLPLLADYRQDIPGIIKAAKDNAKDVGFIYICNPNNPTGNIVTKAEVKQLMDEIPEGIPVLMDEAYHHFVETPDYATSMPLVAAGRPVIVTRTFSKIAALAGVRLGYAVAPAGLIQRMRPYSGAMSTSAVAKLAGVASLSDTAGEKKVKADILGQPGHPVIPL
jgi:histidinol-phosphate aminotransferase